MKIRKLSARNYRTLEEVDITFSDYYTAICGKNDSGKTNTIRALRHLLSIRIPFPFGDLDSFSMPDDYTKWSKADEPHIAVSAEVQIFHDKDGGLHQFLTDYLKIKSDEALVMEIKETLMSHSSESQPSVAVDGRDVTEVQAAEILQRMRNSQVVLFHSSTEQESPLSFTRPGRGILRELSQEFSDKLLDVQKRATGRLKKIAKDRQEEIGRLLGRLKDRYEVGVSIPQLDFSRMPYDLTLSDRKVEVHLENWGSGTKNRTLILLALFRAREIGQSGTGPRKITPVIVIEEPESFLHPSAQAEFGRVLQDLAREFEVQIIATTHSPYMLSQHKPESNILLQRRVYLKKYLMETQVADNTGPNWMKPFGLALGLDSVEFEPWKDVFFGQAEMILLVEGDTDKEYFQLLRDEAHGKNRLDISGEIFSYGGVGALQNSHLIKFLRDKYRLLFITFDLDKVKQVEKSLVRLGLRKKVDYMPVGVDAAGHRSIEGLLPERIRTAVTTENVELVTALQSDNKEEQKDAGRQLKSLYLEKFKAECRPGADDDFHEFYKLAKIVNDALRKQKKS